eukprot:TRINITY_DN11051_c0_g1_i1.p1 TRINITY_DN11051_c0_g1~~TRINITY_DN11051_c0_g1_i1.p1  ORF type:complete len:409 (+),score=68.44 TRINITY_DN11051_c0_g1_i1:515-1741(+)
MAENQTQNAGEEEQTTAAAYWCYQCEKEVTLEPTDMVCSECRNGFVEAVAAAQGFRARPRRARQARVSGFDESNYRRQVLRFLNYIARDVRSNSRRNEGEDNGAGGDDRGQNSADLGPDQQGLGPPSADQEENGSEDYFVEAQRDDEEGEEEDGNSVLDIEVDAYSSLEDEEDEEQDVIVAEDEEEEDDYEVVPELVEGQREDRARDEPSTDLNSQENSRRTGRRDILRFRIRDWNSQTVGANIETSGRAFGWNEILRGLEENTLELRLSLPEEDTYVGDPEDYVDDAGYEILLQNFAENDDTQRGAPPAAKSAVEGLPCVVISKEQADSDAALCAICKEMIPEGAIGKQLPCSHLYHGDCIIPWLNSRNSCPICRFELPTDDADYEEMKKQRTESANADSGEWEDPL